MIEKLKQYDLNPEKDLKKVVKKELSILEKQIGAEKIKAYHKDLEKFILKSLTNTLPSYLSKFNAKNFDKDGIKGFSKEELSNYLKTLYVGLYQLIEAKGYDNLSEVYEDVKDIHWYDVDLFLADKANKVIEEVLGDGSWGEDLLKEVGNYSEEEIKKMEEKKFDMFSSLSWKETIILVAKEIPDSIKGILKFFADLPGAIFLIIRYLTYRGEALIGNEEAKLKYQILSESNSVLALLNLLGPEGIEMFKKLVELVKSGTQGAVAMTVVTIFGLLAGGAGAVKFGAKVADMEELANVAGTVERFANKVDWTINTGGANVMMRPAFIRLAGKLNTAENVVKENAKLSDDDRIKVAEKTLGRKLTDKQKRALLDAHYVGSEREGAGVYNYTMGELLRKNKILKEAGFTKTERDKLVRKGLVGEKVKSVDKNIHEVADILSLNDKEIKEFYDLIKHLTKEDAENIKKSRLLFGISSDQYSILKFFFESHINELSFVFKNLLNYRKQFDRAYIMGKGVDFLGYKANDLIYFLPEKFDNLVEKSKLLKKYGIELGLYDIKKIGKISRKDLENKLVLSRKKIKLFKKTGRKVNYETFEKIGNLNLQELRNVIKLENNGFDFFMGNYDIVKGLTDDEVNNIIKLLKNGIKVDFMNLEGIKLLSKEDINKIIILKTNGVEINIEDFVSVNFSSLTMDDINHIVELNKSGFELDTFDFENIKGLTKEDIKNIITLKNFGITVDPSDFVLVKGLNKNKLEMAKLIKKILSIDDSYTILVLTRILKKEAFGDLIRLKKDFNIDLLNELGLNFIVYVSDDLKTLVENDGKFNVEILSKVFSNYDFTEYDKLVEFLKNHNQLDLITSQDNFIYIISHGGYKLGKLYQEQPDLFYFNNKLKSVLSIIFNSPSSDLQKIGANFLPEILKSHNPKAVVEDLNEIFVKNHLPFVGKLYKIIQSFYPDGVFQEFLASRIFKGIPVEQAGVSPYLLAIKDNYSRAIFTLYRDILKNYVYSGNTDLLDYFKFLKKGKAILDKFENGKQLTKTEKQELQIFFTKLSRLFKELNIEIEATDNLQEIYSKIKSKYGVENSDQLIQKLSNSFLKPIGIKNLDEAISIMENVSKNTDLRNRKLVEGKDKLFLEKGDLVHGTKLGSVRYILDSGFRSGDLLGVDKVDDLVPFSHNLVEIQKDVKDSLIGEEMGITQGWGNVKFVTKDRGQFFRTNKEIKQEPDLVKVWAEKRNIIDLKNWKELFKKENRFKYERYYGGPHDNQVLIRTGLPSSEIDFIVVKSEDLSKHDLQKLYFEIARKGFYIPVVDNSGKIIFKPEDFDKWRRIFYGIDLNIDVDIVGLKKESLNYEKIKQFLPTDYELAFTKKISDYIKNQVYDLLKDNFGIDHFTKLNASDISKAKMDDTGSTGRLTNLMDSFDFDYSLQISASDMKKIDEIKQTLLDYFNPEKSEVYDQGDGLQIRMFGVDVKGQKTDIDIFINQRPEKPVVEAHDAIKMKLDYIKNKYGEEKYKEVIANIRYAKKFFKDLGVYKKGINGEGGLGGIGIETWILQNGGSFDKALETMKQAILKSKNFDEFKDNYPILGAGDNIKTEGMENFTYNMTEEGYEKIRKALGYYR